MSVALAVSVNGQSSVGQHVSSGWFDGAYEITQGWGAVQLSLEPPGHGYAHWHAGVDLGLPCGTTLKLPHGLNGVARWVDNPGGYGTALRIELYTMQVVGGPSGQAAIVRKRTFDVWFGHLRQRLASDGQELHGGEHVAVSNNTGNTTGCHLHFEVRPAGARYGTDVDPGTLLFTTAGDPSQSNSSSNGNPYNDLDPRHGFWDLEHQLSAGITSAQNTALGLGQTALGSTMLLGGLAIVAFGLRGKTGAQLGASVRSTISGARRRQAAGEYQRESTQQGEVGRDVAEQAAERRAAAAQAAGERRNTVGSYRAGLISRQVAQRRLGEPVRATGRRPTRVAYGRGQLPGGPGTYRKGRGTVEVKDPGIKARRSRVRLSHQRDFPIAPNTGAGEIPF